MALTDNLVSVYNFLGNANDSFGSNHGEITGATLTNGKVLTCYDFDGTNDSVNITSLQSLGQSYTISLWAYSTRNTIQEQVLEISDTSTPIKRIRLDNLGNANLLEFGVYDGSWTKAVYNSELPLNTWVHIVLTYDGTNMKIYINNNLEDTTGKATSPEPSGYMNIGTGAWEGSTGNFFRGKINNLNIWSVALDQTIITELYNSGHGMIYNETTALFEDSGLKENLVSVYNFLDDNVEDSLGINDGTNGGSTFTNGKVLTGRNFDGSNDTIDTTYSFPNAESFTINTWAKLTQEDTYRGLMGIYELNAGFILRTDNNQSTSFFFGIKTGSSGGYSYKIFTNTDVNDGEYHLYTITYNDSTSLWSLYIDDSLQDTVTQDYKVTSSATLYLGVDGNGVGDFWDGAMNNVDVWNRVLTTTEVTTLYNSGSGQIFNPKTLEFEDSGLREGLVSNYNFTKDATDSLSLNDGTVTGATLVSTGNIGNAYSFDGTNDYITLPTITEVKAFSLWFNSGIDIVDGSTYNIITNWDISNTNKSIWLGSITGSFTNELVSFLSDTGDFYYWTFADCGVTTPLAADAWHHMLITWDTTGSKYRLYFDGVDAGLANTSGTPNEVTTWSTPYLGRRDTFYFTGKFDNIKFFSRELSSVESSTDYNSGVGKYYSSELLDFIDGDDLKVDEVFAWHFDSLVKDSHDTQPAVLNGTTSYETSIQKLGSGAIKIGTSTGTNFVDTQITSGVAPRSMSFWLYTDLSGGTNNVNYFLLYGNSKNLYLGLPRSVSSILNIEHYNGSAWVDSGTNLTDATWQHIVLNNMDWTAGTFDLWLDNTKIITSGTIRSTAGTDGYVKMGFLYNYTAGNFNMLDEVNSWDRNLSDTEITTLYASGDGYQYPFDPILADLANAIMFGSNF